MQAVTRCRTRNAQSARTRVHAAGSGPQTRLNCRSALRRAASFYSPSPRASASFSRSARLLLLGEARVVERRAQELRIDARAAQRLAQEPAVDAVVLRGGRRAAAPVAALAARRRARGGKRARARARGRRAAPLHAEPRLTVRAAGTRRGSVAVPVLEQQRRHARQRRQRLAGESGHRGRRVRWVAEFGVGVKPDPAHEDFHGLDGAKRRERGRARAGARRGKCRGRGCARAGAGRRRGRARARAGAGPRAGRWRGRLGETPARGVPRPRNRGRAASLGDRGHLARSSRPASASHCEYAVGRGGTGMLARSQELGQIFGVDARVVNRESAAGVSGELASDVRAPRPRHELAGAACVIMPRGCNALELHARLRTEHGRSRPRT
jgi:hypothetical protein